MLALAERHKDRAKRIAENRTERDNFPVATAAAAIIAARQAADLIAGLDEEGRAEFEEAMKGYDPTTSHSLAENDKGETMAGIGVINTKVVPASAEGGNGGGSAPGWTDIPETPDLGGSNINGAALEAQGAEVTPPKRTTRAAADKGE